MAANTEDLVRLLDLSAVGADAFVGLSPETRLQRVFGGQVAAQSLIAAARTVDADRPVHSLHAYFLRPGVPAQEIRYTVERVREGRAFSTRRVTASQGERVIFVMSANFQQLEFGYDHQDPMPEVADPETLPTMLQRAESEPAWWGGLGEGWSALEVRAAVDPPPGYAGTSHRTHSQVWFRTAGPLPEDSVLHAAVMAYASDLTLLGTSLFPHGVTPRDVQMASLDHAMWFHAPVRADHWLLYDQISPWAGGSRGLSAGRVFDQQGRLVATVMQEGLIRPLP